MPHDLVVVLHLHHPVALPEDVPHSAAPLILPRRIQRRLNRPVQVGRPVAYFRVGDSTWIWSAGIPMFFGSRVWHSSTMVSTADCPSFRRIKKKSRSFLTFRRSGSSPG